MPRRTICLQAAYDAIVLFFCSSSIIVDGIWILNSACFYHNWYIIKIFCTFSKSNGSILMAIDQSCRFEGVGSVKICMFDGVNCTLIHVRCIPNMTKNLISLGVVDSHGLEWSSRYCVLDVKSCDKKVILGGHKHKIMYLLEITIICREINLTRFCVEMSHVWHLRLDHMNDRYMYLFDEKNMLSGVGKIDLTFCEHCIMGKQHMQAFGVGTHRFTKNLEYVHSDVWGCFPIVSLSRKLFYVSLIDYCSRYVWICFLSHKSGMFSTFKSWRISNYDQARLYYQNMSFLKYISGVKNYSQISLYIKSFGFYFVFP